MDDHPAAVELALEGLAHPRRVGRQQLGSSGKQVEFQFIRVAAHGRKLIAQAVLHGQRQLHPAGATADGDDARGPGMLAHALEQRQPAIIETVNGLDRHRVLGRTGHHLDLRRRADVDRQPIVGHRRARFAQHALAVAVDADGFIAKKARAGELGQATQIDMHLVVSVMAGDVAGQHARIRRVRVAADQRQAHARNRLHAEALEHADVTVATADQNDIPQDRLIRLLHRSLSRFAGSSIVPDSRRQHGVLGSYDRVHAMAREGFYQENPEAALFLARMHLHLDDLQNVMFQA